MSHVAGAVEPAGPRRRVARALVLLAALQSFVACAYVARESLIRLAHLGQSPEPWVATYERRFVGARALLPPRGPVGYEGDRSCYPVPEDYFRDFFAAQSALVPLTLLLEPGDGPEYLVVNVPDPIKAGARARRDGYVVLGDFGNGVVVLRRGGLR